MCLNISYIFCLESEADRLAMYGMMGDQSDEEDTMYGEMGEQSDEESDRSDEEENIATSDDDDESDDGINEMVGRCNIRSFSILSAKHCTA